MKWCRGARSVRPRLLGLTWLLVTAWVWGWSPTTGWSQKPPEAVYVFPPAVAAGTTTEVQFGGYDFTTDMEWFVHHPQVTCEVLGPPGPHHLPPPPFWTGPRASVGALPLPREVPGRLTVAADCPEGLVRWQVASANGASTTAMLYVSRGREVVESRFRDQPQDLGSLPVAVSGRLSRLTEVDRYLVTAAADGPVTVDVLARRLGANFQAIVEVHDQNGTRIAEAGDTLGQDLRLTFPARAQQQYTVSLRDADFRGDRTYVYRLALTTEAPQAALPPGVTAEFATVDAGDRAGDAALELPSTPVLARGRFDDSGQSRRFTWMSNKDAFWSLQALSQGIGADVDVALVVLDPTGKQIAENDDLTGLTDAGVTFRAAAEGQYTAVVKSVSDPAEGGDTRFALVVAPQTPGFQLTVPQQIAVPLGGSFEVTVLVTRLAGFNGEIQVRPLGLPDGVATDGDWTIPAGKPNAKLKLTAAADARVVARAIQFEGTASIDDTPVSVIATAIAGGNMAPRTLAETLIDHSLLAIFMTPPFDLNLVDKTRQRDVHLGTTCRAEFIIHRHEGFDGPVLLEMAAKQARYRRGIHGPTITIPAGVSHAIYPSFMPEWLATDLTERMAVHGVVTVLDPHGVPRQLVKPADAQVTMILEGALLKISSSATEPELSPGESIDIPFELARSAKLPESATVELVVPEELEGLLTAEQVVLPYGENRGVLRVTAGMGSPLTGDWPITLRATALEEGEWPVRSQIELPLTFLTTPGPSPK